MLRSLAIAVLFAAGISRASSIQYTISNDVYNECSGYYCTGGPFSLTVTFTVPSGTDVDNLSFDQGPLNGGEGGNIQPYITSFSATDGTGLLVNSSNVVAGVNGSGHNYYVNIATDSNGNITAWYINLTSATDFAWTYWFPTYPQVYYNSGVAGEGEPNGSCFDYGQNPLPSTTCLGTTSMQTVGPSGAPEPSSWTLIVLGSFLLLLRQYFMNKLHRHRSFAHRSGDSLHAA